MVERVDPGLEAEGGITLLSLPTGPGLTVGRDVCRSKAPASKLSSCCIARGC